MSPWPLDAAATDSQNYSDSELPGPRKYKAPTDKNYSAPTWLTIARETLTSLSSGLEIKLFR